jgi:hypothetical protein
MNERISSAAVSTPEALYLDGTGQLLAFIGGVPLQVGAGCRAAFGMWEEQSTGDAG